MMRHAQISGFAIGYTLCAYTVDLCCDKVAVRSGHS